MTTPDKHFVYLVTHSDYECANFKGIFSTKENALAFIDYAIANPKDFEEEFDIGLKWTDRESWGWSKIEIDEEMSKIRNVQK